MEITIAIERISVSLPESLEAHIRKQIELRGAESLSQYFAGLVCLDMLLSAKEPIELPEFQKLKQFS